MTRVRAIEILRPGPPGEGMDPGQVAELEAFKAREETQVFDVRKYSGSPPEQFAAAISAAATSGGGKVLGPDSAYDFTGLTETIAVPDNVHIEGNGGTITAPAGINFPVFTIDSADNATISNFHLVKDDGADATGSGFGVQIVGTCDSPTIDRVTADGFRTGINVNGNDGTTPGEVTNITLRQSWGINSKSLYGINLAYVTGGTVENCVGNLNWLDGMKFTAKVVNVDVIGGRYDGNGQSYIGGGGSAGDGIDTFAGADGCSFIGVTTDYNQGNGITIKTDTLTRDNPETYGYVRATQVVGCRARHNQVGSGFTFYRFPLSDTTIPMAAEATFGQNISESNAKYGFYFNGRNMVSAGDVARHNGQHGFFIDLDARYATLISPVSVANSQESAGSYHGIYIRGEHIAVRGGTVLGVDSDEIKEDGDYAALTKYHGRNIYITSQADDVYIDIDFQDYNATSQGIRSDMTSGSCVIHQRGSLLNVPASSGAYGGIGSTFNRTNASDPLDQLWVKRIGQPNQATTGWARPSDPIRVTTLPAASSTYKGAFVLKDNAGASDDTLHICVQTDSGYAWREVTLT